MKKYQVHKRHGRTWVRPLYSDYSRTYVAHELEADLPYDKSTGRIVGAAVSGQLTFSGCTRSVSFEAWATNKKGVAQSLAMFNNLQKSIEKARKDFLELATLAGLVDDDESL